MKKLFAILLTVFAIAVCGAAFVACGDGNNGGGNDNWGSVQEPKLTISVIDYNNQSRNLYSFEENPTRINVNAGQRTGYEFQGLVDANGIQYVDADGNVSVSLTNGMTLYESWSEIGFGEQYTIRFEEGGYAQSAVSDISVTVGSAVSGFPSITPQAGWEFVGWFASQNGDSTQYSDGNTLREEYKTFHIYDYAADGETITLYARYEVKMVEYKFYNGTQELTELTAEFEYNADITGKLPVLEDTDTQVFLGWSIYSYDISGDYLVTGGNAVVDTILYAVFRDKVNITFYEQTDGTPVVKSYPDGETITLPAPADYPGYAFVGWYDNPQFSRMPVTRVTVYAGNTYTYYARWEETSYTITFEGDGTDGLSDVRYYYGDDDDLPEPERAGYSFAGWCLVPQEEMGEDDEPFFSISADMYGDKTLYAVWEPEVYTIYFDPNGGDAVATAGAATYGENYIFTPAERTGYTFLGWFSDAEGGTQYTDDHGRSLDAWNETEGRTLYAQWTINTYMVRYETDGGTTVRAQKYEHGEKIELPENPIKNGLYFSGWYSDAEFTQEVSSSSLVLSDMTLYARWVESIAVSSADALKAIVQDTAANYHLTRDINLNGEVWTPIEDFTGILNGNSFKIYNFTMSNANCQRFGFFATNHGEIRNLTLSDFSFTCIDKNNDISEHSYGTLIGENSGKVMNCHVESSVVSIDFSITATESNDSFVAMNAGGLIGKNFETGLISNCSSDTEILLDLSSANRTTNGYWGRYCNLVINYYAGGLCGSNYGNLNYSSSSGSMEISASGTGQHVTYSGNLNVEMYAKFGGLVGYNSGLCERGYAQFEINANESTFDRASYWLYIGGFISYNIGEVKECLAHGSIKVLHALWTLNIGGVVSFAETDSLVTDCYSDVSMSSSGKVDYLKIGGIVGDCHGAIVNSFADAQINYADFSYADVGGLVGYMRSSGSVSNSFSLSDISVKSMGTMGAIVGTNEGSVRNCYYAAENVFTVNGEPVTDFANDIGESVAEKELFTSEFLVQSLYWSSSVWSFEDGVLPEVNWVAAQSAE